MADYSVSGDFGQVKFFDACVNSGRFCSLDHISRFGWHKVNEKYHINRLANSGCNHLLIVTLSGRGNVIVGEKEFVATPQTVVVIPSDKQNSYCGVMGEEWEFYWIHYYGKNADQFTKDITREDQYLFEIDCKMLDLLIERTKNSLLVGTQREIKEAQTLSKIFYMLLSASFGNEQNPQKETDIVNAMIEFLKNAEGEFCLTSLADHFHYSREHTIRLFKSVTGMTPYYYWESLRLEECCMMLESGSASMLEIALKSGFKNVNNFSRQFKKTFGVSPTKYRKLYGLFKN